MDWERVVARIVTAMAPAIWCLSDAAPAAMTPDQMTALKGAAQLETTVDELFRNCGLPAAVVDHGQTDSAKQAIYWQGVEMRLSSMDWDAAYRERPREHVETGGWVNTGKIDSRCTSGLSGLLFHSKGDVGVLTLTKKAQGFGYITTYSVSKDLFKAHKVIGVKATLARSRPAAALAGRYGQPDEVLSQAGIKTRFRYWVLTLRENRPETLHAVDFEIDNGTYRNYEISSSSNDFVRQRLEALLRKWERDYVLD